eukprot:8472111-Alexandrium_andersonii.AAC.1
MSCLASSARRLWGKRGCGACGMVACLRAAPLILSLRAWKRERGSWLHDTGGALLIFCMLCRRPRRGGSVLAG